MTLTSVDAAWGLYNNAHINPVPLETAYEHHFLMFTDQLHIGVPVSLGGPDNADSSKLVDPITGVVGNTNALLCLEPARIARGTTLSMGINCVFGGVVIPKSTSNSSYDAVADGLYDAEIDAWAVALLAYKAMGVYQMHVFFQLEPAATNQPADKGSAAEFKAAFARVYSRFTSAGVQAAGIKVGWDSDAADWRVPSRAAPRALDWEPTTYDVCSADFYPTVQATQNFSFGLEDNNGASPNTGFLHNAVTNHPTNPILVRSSCPKPAALGGGDFTDAGAAAWFTDANTHMEAWPDTFLGVGWDPQNVGLDILSGTEVYPYTGKSSPLTKAAFRNAAIEWPEMIPSTPSGTTTTITTDQNLTGLHIMAGDTYVLSPTHNITITIAVDYTNTVVPDNMILVEGTLVSHPDSTHTHTILFTGIDESKFVGGPVADMMNPPTTDPGIFVVMDGVLDLVGKTRVRWNNTGTDATWAVGDTLKMPPWADADDRTVGTTFTPGVTDLSAFTFDTPDGVTHTREVFNLTSNLNFTASGGLDVLGNPIGTSGSRGGFGHMMIMSSMPQTIKYVAFNNWGPQVFSRWAVHFHKVGDASRGTEVTGCVVNEGKAHAFVPHHSNGITFTDCITFHNAGDAFWYDSSTVEAGGAIGGPNAADGLLNAPDDLEYDHCGVFCQLPASVIPGDPNIQNSAGGGFLIESNQFQWHNHIHDCVVAGTPDDSSGSEKSAYFWSAHGVTGNSSWNFHNNNAHNCDRAFSVWQNDDDPHFVGVIGGEGGTVSNTGAEWRCGKISGGSNNVREGWLNGAYSNAFHVNGLVMSDVLSATASCGSQFDPSGPQRRYYNQRWTNCYFNVVHHGGCRPLTSRSPMVFQDCSTVDFNIDHIQFTDGGKQGDNFGQQLIDIINPTGITPVVGAKLTDHGFSITSKNSLTALRIQMLDGTAFGVDWGTFTGGTVLPPSCGPVSPDVGRPYSRQQTPPNGTTGPWTWSLASGTLPPGLTISSGGLLAGTPTLEGTYNYSLRVVDHNGVINTIAYTFIVNITHEWPTNGTEKFTSIAPFSLYVSTTTLGPATQGAPYSATLAVGNLSTSDFYTTPDTGTSTTWSLASGSLPTGVTLSAGGVISGTPSVAGSFAITVQASAIYDSCPRTTQKALTLSVASTGALSISTSTLPGGSVGVAYPLLSGTLAATGGTQPYTWSLASGSLPSGLSLSSAGIISGTPNTAQTSNFTVRVTDNVAAHVNRPLSIQITSLTPSITTASVGPVSVGTAYTQTLTAVNGTTPYTWTKTVGSFPAGISLSSGGVLSGTPTLAGSSTFTVRAADTLGAAGTKAFTMVVNPALDFPLAVLPNGVLSQPFTYSFAASVTGGVPPYFFLAVNESELPVGMSISSAGVLSGTPIVAKTYTVAVIVGDQIGGQVTMTTTLLVRQALVRPGRGTRMRGGSRFVSVR